jgi:hypothetical protein
MTSTDHDLGQFARLVDALEPWLDRVLFIRGWAHRLFRERPEAARLSYPPLRTGDVDVALDPRAPRRLVAHNAGRFQDRRLFSLVRPHRIS